jgi:phospholipase/carboxylesterase
MGAPALLEAVELETGPGPEAAVIWLHGLGADGHDFAPIVPELELPAGLAVRFVLPHAPPRPVTVNGGAVMRAWYDVLDRDGARGEDEAGVRASQAQVAALIEHETARGIPARRIVLAGFSQGGAIALQTGLRHPARLAGVIGLSCYLPLARTLAAEAAPADRAAPIFLAHGVDDPVIPIARARQSRDRLLAAGYRLAWREYRMPHTVCAEELRDIAAWLADVLGAPDDRR